MKDWTYENEQWTKLPVYLRHLPLFTRNLDWTSRFIRFLWALYLRDFVFTNPVRFYTLRNPEFFAGTVVEDTVARSLADADLA